ncbi:MAG: DUF481 domain-containing protein [Candidatus Loosdrechtia sp.]
MHTYWVILIAVLFFGTKASSDEIKMADGTYRKGEVLTITEDAISILQEDGNICSLNFSEISLISRNNEIIIVHPETERKRFIIMKIRKPGGISLKEIDIDTTDTLTFPASDSETHLAAGKEPDRPKIIHGNEQNISKEKSPSVKQEVTSDRKTWKGNIDAGINIKDGNTKSTTLHTKGRYANERSRDNIYFNAIAIYETRKRTTGKRLETINEQRASGKYEFKHTLKLYSFFNQYLEHDELENLNYRSISSPGVGYRFYDSERLQYKAEGGPSYTLERYHGGIREDSKGIRLGHFLDCILLRDTKFYARQEYIQRIDNQKEWRLDSGIGVRHNLRKSIAISLEILSQYDNFPQERNRKDDTTLIGSLGYNF